MSTPTATGRREDRDGIDYVVFRREFRAPIDDVWAAVTDPERLARWIGTWSGDPASGTIAFWMTAESEDAPEETVMIDECRAPTRLVMRSARPDDHSQTWCWQLDLDETGGVTTLTFAQEAVDVTLVESVGPGWDYYLDRMVAAEAGDDVDDVVWDDYYPGFSDHYRSEFS